MLLSQLGQGWLAGDSEGPVAGLGGRRRKQREREERGRGRER